ncbi:MAG: spondin domain-containing protein [bacterium]
MNHREFRAWIPVLACTLSAGSPSPAAQPLAVTYRVDFEATWSAETHPQSFPGFPHFSPLIGGTHDTSVTFWQVGQPATLGIQRMAEWGATSPLDQEIQAAINQGAAGQVIQTQSAFVPSPGTESTTFTAGLDHPLVSLVTMIAPSPDWFVGVSGLSLWDGSAWINTLTVELYGFDAGTDSGPNYSSPDQPTVPPVPISVITAGPLTSGGSVGTFTFILEGAVADVPQASNPNLSVFPNPFNPRTTIAFELDREETVRLDVFDVRGRRMDARSLGRLEPGRHEVIWEGKNPEGRELAAGTYLLRIQVGLEIRSGKLLLAK